MRRLVALQPARLDQADIGGHTLAGFEKHDIIRNEAGRINDLSLTVANDRGMRLLERAQSIGRLAGGILLDRPDNPVDHQHDSDEHRVRDLADQH